MKYIICYHIFKKLTLAATLHWKIQGALRQVASGIGVTDSSINFVLRVDKIAEMLEMAPRLVFLD